MEFGTSTSFFSIHVNNRVTTKEREEELFIYKRKNETKIKSKEDINCGLKIDGFILCFYHRCRLRVFFKFFLNKKTCFPITNRPRVTKVLRSDQKGIF